MILVLIAGIYTVWKPIVWSLIFIFPLVLLGFYDLFQAKHTLKCNFPILGHGQYLLEKIRPEIIQYFVQTDLDGRPINCIFCTLIYQPAKKENYTSPFGRPNQMFIKKVMNGWIILFM